MQTYRKAIAILVGEELVGISNSQHFHNGITTLDDIGEVELELLSGNTICFNLQSDGEGVNVRNGAYEQVNRLAD